MRILLVEDDVLLGDGLARGLAQQGFAVDWFTDGATADAALRGTPYDAIVLDQGLPGRDGLDWLARWRAAAHHLPVLILTARGGLEQRVAGLDTGADDYLVKPIALPELAARLRSALRRSQGRPEPLWRHGALSYNQPAKQVTWEGKAVDLTARELSLLEVFLAHPGRVLSKATLQEKLYAWSEEIDSNALEVHIHHLRRKLHPQLIRTVRGVGYVLGEEALPT
jgi:two-component system response regulator QseB